MFIPDYKQGGKGYRNGFLTGLFLGVSVCLLTGTGWIVAIFFALFGGAFGFQLKMKQNGQIK